MIKIIILLTMLFLHIVDDFYLQGLLAQLKQKKWWEENAPKELYKNDYIIALLEHAFSWTFMIFLPIMANYLFFNLEVNALDFVVAFLFNWGLHATVDHLKANLLVLNLTQDQLIHIMQIVLVWIIFIV
jgi:hypothetical protein